MLHPSDDVNMHLSVRPNEGAIVRNHMVSQSWAAEERHGGCPIQYGERFEILILAESNQFKVRDSFVCLCLCICALYTDSIFAFFYLFRLPLMVVTFANFDIEFLYLRRDLFMLLVR